jgi:hypothetical protein
MASVRRVPSPSSPLIVISGDVALSLDLKVLYPDDEDCPNESQRLEDAIGYSREEKKDNSIGREEAL